MNLSVLHRKVYLLDCLYELHSSSAEPVVYDADVLDVVGSPMVFAPRIVPRRRVWIEGSMKGQ
jgi:hypothetical protein